jgi:hypothetical protein
MRVILGTQQDVNEIPHPAVLQDVHARDLRILDAFGDHDFFI